MLLVVALLLVVLWNLPILALAWLCVLIYMLTVWIAEKLDQRGWWPAKYRDLWR